MLKKRTVAFMIAFIMVFSLAGCGNSPGSKVREQSASESQEITSSNTGEAEISPEDAAVESSRTELSAEPETQEPEGPRTLVVFFSRHGNTLDGVDAVTSATLSGNDVTILAGMIVEASAEADLHQIITEAPYPADYNECTEVARSELDSDARPALMNSVGNMAQYDTVYLGYPNWWGTIPMPVATFLEAYDFTGKTIVPFCTHEGSGLGSSEEHIARLAPNATVLDGFAVSGNQADGARKDITEWMRGLNLIS